jgi:HSP20 family protein
MGKPGDPFLPHASAEHAEICWSPPADIYRAPGEWLVKFDLAGVRLQDIQVVVRGRRLTVAGVRRDWTTAQGRQTYLMEISYNRFERTVELPCEISELEIEHEYRDGMLLIRVYPREESR